MSNMITKSVRIFTLASLAAFFGIGFFSCSKDTKCQGDIYVVYLSTGLPVVGANVYSHYQAGGRINDNQKTDATGKVHLSLDLPAILTEDVTGPAPTGGTGTATLKYEPGTTNTVTIKI